MYLAHFLKNRSSRSSERKIEGEMRVDNLEITLFS